MVIEIKKTYHCLMGCYKTKIQVLEGANRYLIAQQIKKDTIMGNNLGDCCEIVIRIYNIRKPNNFKYKQRENKKCNKNNYLPFL